ncbi:hypothetical protein A2631_01370 [Candidatus Daviesbacteria bacterium RIFCSPHIGHO2_01_FULL_44_29]|uniref:Uncharacterized protein n=1 Tax=Candidatus Daviesbacteria bacterium RIFCSPHIGHO2_02_FULL_43_12 TaxID=1797776 RepID=A0A1F5KLQ3_9BACT|nr:MAG: hypothetical protein A2631_01370 [Candidatus Daviesbacteria bacterium RIFCSPHIGHO2_01_FULL_44_29]OGE39682.1 MAG: hypothetical protein A3E86_00070 [Candidatus Daviesbacteria bacterium RIFCSPHIGHO2_12_FULL_47_45]OGE41541.1 MAG: hypothetical protein A3D25_00790 [Candidatus Daviesbacteria bacterium RIFCSPHIGHO2_02_FULL_43_12]OGE69823.1 MAG: hypothetical protein A3B55_05435 [Candidatus Daviesbacteria bacterium RIFCSPLOWO2_01_FULL_43_15]
MAIHDRSRVTPEIYTYPISVSDKLAMEVAIPEPEVTGQPFFAASWLTNVPDADGLAAVLRSIDRTANAYNPWYAAQQRNLIHNGNPANNYEISTGVFGGHQFASLVDFLWALRHGKAVMAQVAISGKVFNYALDGTQASSDHKRLFSVSGAAFDRQEIMNLFAETTGENFRPWERRVIRRRLGQTLLQAGLPNLTRPPRMGRPQPNCPPGYISYR